MNLPFQSTATRNTTASACGCNTPRRSLSGLLALGAGAALPGCVSPQVTSASSAMAVRDRIDTHHHFFSPAHLAELEKINDAPPITRNWSVARTLDDMNKAGVTTTILSATTPQVTFLDAPNARRVARESNEWAARLGKDHPGRFGSFAMLPMQDTDGALREMEYALDVLKADGIGLLTSYNDKGLYEYGFSATDLRAIERGNALRLLPRWNT